MATLSKVLLSGSTGGRGIKVAATATAGTTIHTTGTSASVLDIVTLFAYNDDTAPITLTIEFGGASDPDDTIVQSIPVVGSGLVLVVPGLPLTGDGSAGRVVRAFAGTANKVTVFGEVNRIA
jgi:hypothetical protein